MTPLAADRNPQFRRFVCEYVEQYLIKYRPIFINRSTFGVKYALLLFNPMFQTDGDSQFMPAADDADGTTCGRNAQWPPR
jgi:hypothetical protein